MKEFEIIETRAKNEVCVQFFTNEGSRKFTENELFEFLNELREMSVAVSARYSMSRKCVGCLVQELNAFSASKTIVHDR